MPDKSKSTLTTRKQLKYPKKQEQENEQLKIKK